MPIDAAWRVLKNDAPPAPVPGWPERYRKPYDESDYTEAWSQLPQEEQRRLLESVVRRARQEEHRRLLAQQPSQSVEEWFKTNVGQEPQEPHPVVAQRHAKVRANRLAHNAWAAGRGYPYRQERRSQIDSEKADIARAPPPFVSTTQPKGSPVPQEGEFIGE